jgi:hypothetical protein
MTPEQYTKIKAHEYLMRFKNLGLTWEKSQDCALILVQALADQYLKTTKDTPDRIAYAKQNFDNLISCINAFLKGRDYVEIPIEEIAALKSCKKSQVLITY